MPVLYQPPDLKKILAGGVPGNQKKTLDMPLELVQGKVEVKRRPIRLIKMWLYNMKDWTQLSVDDSERLKADPNNLLGQRSQHYSFTRGLVFPIIILLFI